jgi:hypothetical protein
MTVVCLASGPSLTPADVDYCRGKAFVLAIKDAIRLAPWADAMYACDGRWWRAFGPTLTFAGQRFGMDPAAAEWGATVLSASGDEGLEVTDRTSLRTGRNAGYQAIGLAVHLGATKIVLLGYDMQPAEDCRDHWFGPHTYPGGCRPNYALFLPYFSLLVKPLRDLGIAIWNCTRRTALTCFPQCSLAEALA